VGRIARRSALAGWLLTFGWFVRSAGAAASVDVTAEYFGASWTTGDDFASGALHDGDPGEVAAYDAPCGGVDDDAKADGRLRLAGPGSNCSGAIVARPRVILAPEFHLRARYRLTVAPANISVGFVVETGDFAQSRDVLIERGDLLGPGTDALGIVLRTGTTVAERALLSSDAATYLAQHPTIELELYATGGDNGLPSGLHARYRACPVEACSASDVFADLEYVVTPGQAVIDGHDPWQLGFFANGQKPFAVDLLDWSLDMHASDPLSVFENRIAYPSHCVSLRNEHQAMVATPENPNECGGSWASPVMEGPGATSIRASFAWSLPEPCSMGYGVALVADRLALPSVRRGAYVFVMRGPLEGYGDDVVYAVLQVAAAPPAQPWLELLAVWGTLDVTPWFDSIELRLDLHPDDTTGLLLPHGTLKTCAGVTCETWPYASYDLQPYSFPQTDPVASYCGWRAASFAPPADGGAIEPDVALMPALLFAPEPDAHAAGVAALALVLLLGRARSIRAGSMPRRGSTLAA